MATKSRNSPFSRLSRIGLALGMTSIQVTGNHNSQGEDDSYIPYNGPYEPPTRGREIRGYWDNGAQDTTPDARSFSHLSLDGRKAHAPYNQPPSISNGRRHSNASRLTLSNVMTEPRRRFSRVRQNGSPPPQTSYVSLDRAGGIGDTPVPVHRSTPSHSSSSKRHDSIFRASVTDLRKSFSKSGSRHEKTHSSGTSSDDHVHRNVTRPYGYEHPPRRSRSNSVTVGQRHPYAVVSSSHPGQTSIQTNPRSQKRDQAEPPQNKASAHLKPSSRASLLKSSVSTPDLRSASRQPTTYVKPKTHWLSAETWCDAFMLPRPRFLSRHLEENPTVPEHRLVSPAESVVSGLMQASVQPKSLKKSLSASALRIPNFPKVIPNRAEGNNTTQSLAPRPRSFALDDLALPDPMPSLMTVLADRQNLQNERQMWQERASNSFGNKRTRSLSRSGSRGKARKPSCRHPPAGTFDYLVERTLLGHQAIPSPVHTSTNSSAIPTQSTSVGGQATRPLASTLPLLRSKSHGHSRSAGSILDGPGHRRGGSISSALRCAKSTATGLCVGADGTSNRPDASVEKGGTKAITPSNRRQGTISPHSVILVSPFANQERTSPDRGFLIPSHRRPHTSPASSGQFAEGIGIAITSPLPSEEHPNGDPITLPTHPYAQGVNNHHSPPATTTPTSEATHHRQPVVHPYAVGSAHPATLSVQWVHHDQTVSPARRMFAEVVPGHLREIRPEEIQYSPYIEDTPGAFTTPHTGFQPVDPTPHGDNDVLRMGDALNLSLTHNRLSSSTDSGIGTSEDPHPYGPQPVRTMSRRSNTFPLPQVREVLDTADDNSNEGTSGYQWLEPSVPLPRAHSDNSEPASLHADFSDRVNPSVFTGPQTPIQRIESSGSSPGLSNDSSPPLTPRQLGRLDDLERFQDLFYNPSVNRPELPSVAVPVTEAEDRRVPVNPVNLTRSRSQLTTLVRQLSEDLHELRNVERVPEEDDGLEGPNDEQSRDPMAFVGGSSWSDDSPSVLGSTHLFLPTLPPLYPLDHPVVSSRQNFPEDVASEVSSLSDGIPVGAYDEITETLRLGNVEAVSTPPPVSSLRRQSGHVDLVDDMMNPTAGAISSSGLVLPSTSLTRSSHLTIESGGSRISGLSAFPRPPSDQSADILASYFAAERDDDDMPELISAALHSPVKTTGENQGGWTHSP